MKKIFLILIAALTMVVACDEIYDATYGYVRRVTLNTNQVVLVLGEDQSFQLEATISPITAPNRLLIWSSSNWSVAEVDDKGVITPKSVGEAVVTVKTDDGGYTDKCAVTVIDAEGSDQKSQ